MFLIAIITVSIIIWLLCSNKEETKTPMKYTAPEKVELTIPSYEHCTKYPKFPGVTNTKYFAYVNDEEVVKYDTEMECAIHVAHNMLPARFKVRVYVVDCKGKNLQ